MTLVGRMSFERMALIPSRPIDKAKLRELGIRGYVYPLDEALGLDRLPFKMTVGVMLEIAKESSRCESYEEAEKTLRERTSIRINDDTMRQVTNTVGSIVFNNDVIVAERIWKELNAGQLVFSKSRRKGTLYLEVDGAMLPTRQEDQKGAVYKENKLGMAFTTDNIRHWTDKHGKPQHQIDKREYTALIGESDQFNKLMFSLAIKNGYGKYENTVIISDGATWMRNMKDLLFPDAQQILDYYHLKEHVTDFFKLIYNNDTNKYAKKSENVCSLIYESKLDDAKEVLTKSCKLKNKDDLEKLLNYLDNNKNNIDYAEYRAKDYFIGSGAIESSNKTVLQRRLKYGAMRWHVKSAQSVVTLVAKSRSGLWMSDVVEPIHLHYGMPYHSLNNTRIRY
jgi:ribosomal protein L22